jgi:myo-inositol-1(or 4)-monophosphatase
LLQTVKSAKSILLQGATNIKEKGFANYVTSADIAAQKIIIQKLKNKYPDCAIIAEEQRDMDEENFEGLGNKIIFILDPIDGTTNFKFGLNYFAISLACCIDQKLSYGIVYDPINEEMFWAQDGKGAYLNGKKIQVNQKTKLKECLITIGTSPYSRKNTQEMFALFEKIFVQCGDIRRLGSAALDICYTACGRMDGFLEAGLHIWDYAAALIILKEAGGKATDFSGKPVKIDKFVSDIAAANADINKSLINIIGGFDVYKRS